MPDLWTAAATALGVVALLGLYLASRGRGVSRMDWRLDTQEAIRGPAGTREALRLFFGLLLLLLLGMVLIRLLAGTLN